MRGSPVGERILFHLSRNQWRTRKDIAQVLGRKYGMGPSDIIALENLIRSGQVECQSQKLEGGSSRFLYRLK